MVAKLLGRSKKASAPSANKRQERLSGFKKLNIQIAFGSEARADLYEDIAAYLDAGISINEAFAKMESVMTRRKHPLAPMIQEWNHLREEGATMAEVMANWIPADEAGMLAGGEVTGDVGNSFVQMAELTRQKTTLRSLLTTKLVPPALLIIAMLAMLYFISKRMVPAIEPMLPPSMMPGVTKAYFAMGNFVINFGPVIGIALVATLIAIFFSFPRWVGGGRDRADKFFPWTTYRSIQSGFLLITIAAMSRSGMNMSEIVKKLHPYANKYMQMHLDRTSLKMKTGQAKPTEAIDTGLLPTRVVDRLEIYSVLPDFSTVMDAMGKNVMKKMDADFSKLSASINMIVMLLAAAFIIFTLAGIGMAALQLSDVASARH